MARKSVIKPTHRSVKAYYESLATFADQRVGHETAVRSAFQTLLAEMAGAKGRSLIPRFSTYSEPAVNSEATTSLSVWRLSPPQVACYPTGARINGSATRFRCGVPVNAQDRD